MPRTVYPSLRAQRLLFVFLLAAVLLVVLLSTLSAPPVQAGGVVGPPCDEAAFTARLDGGGNVSFNCGVPATIFVLNQKFITQTTTIDGGGVITLNGKLATRLFQVSNGVTLTL